MANDDVFVPSEERCGGRGGWFRGSGGIGLGGREGGGRTRVGGIKGMCMNIIPTEGKDSTLPPT